MSENDGRPNLNISVTPPDNFNFACPEGWPQWKRRMERYMSVSGLQSRTEDEKINTLLYVMGEESEQILLQFAAGPSTLNSLLSALDSYFIPVRNVIFERFKFNSRVQKSGESIESFISDLHTLAEHCEFQSLKDELIRDRIVVGMLDVKTSERMQLTSNLKLKSAVDMARQAEMQNQQSQVLRQEHQHQRAMVNAVQKGNKGTFQRNNPPSKEMGSRKTMQVDKKDGKKCEYCGYSLHTRDKCPAKSEKCKGCGKVGHFKAKCRSKNMNVHAVETEEDVFLGYVEIKNVNSLARNKEWIANVFVDSIGVEIAFQIDSGTDITCLPDSYLNESLVRELRPSSLRVAGPDDKSLKVFENYRRGRIFVNRKFILLKG